MTRIKIVGAHWQLARRIRFEDGEEVEIRRVAEPTDFAHNEVSGRYLDVEQKIRDAQKPIKL